MAKEAGWYKDPSDPDIARWHDGTTFTDHTVVMSEHTGPPPPPEPDLIPAFPDPTPLPVPAAIPPTSEAIPPSAAPLPPAPQHAPLHAAQHPLEGAPPRDQRAITWFKRPKGLAAIIVVVAVLVVAGLLVHRSHRSGGDSVDASTDQTADTDTSATTEAVTEPTVQVPSNDAELVRRVMAGLVVPDKIKDLSDAIKADPQVEALMDFEYLRNTNEVYLDIASTYQGGADERSFYDDQAWTLTMALSAAYWNADIQAQVVPDILPALHIRLDSELNYTCPGSFMAQVANKTVGQESFNTTCRQ